MDSHVPTLILSLSSIVGVSIISWTMLAAWRDWLALKRMEFAPGNDIGGNTAGARIELAALKERVRQLEAIASGVDLLP